MSEENKLQKYGVVSISRGGEVWDEVQKNNSGNYYLVEDVDLVIEKYKEENEKLEITIRADRIDSNTLEERMSEATHYTWLDGRIESVERKNEKLKEQLSIAKDALEYISHDCLNSETHCPTRDSMRVKSKFALKKIKNLEEILK